MLAYAVEYMKFPVLKNKFILAPMSGVTDVAFREMSKAGMTYSEFVSSEALIRGKVITKTYAATLASKILRSAKEDIFGIQIFGNSAESVASAVKIVQPKCDVIDINMGCPAWCILRQDSGGALLSDLDKIESVVRAVLDVAKKPVSVKIRSGFSSNNYLKVGSLASDLGVSAVTLHPRLARQRFSGAADWNQIKRLKSKLDIPVIGNGDVFSAEDSVRMLDETKCDYVMIGRCARKNPFIFEQTNSLLNTGKYVKESFEDRKKWVLDYIKLGVKYGLSVPQLRSHAIWVISGSESAKKFRREASLAGSVEEVRKLVLGL